jgi:tetratricopeptide (TPR) repeat protein
MVDGTRLTFEDGEKAVSLARDVEKQSATISDDLIHGRSLIILGLVLDNSGHRQEVLRHLERAKLKVKESTLISDALYSIALVHYHEDRLPQALEAVKEAWGHAESSNSLVDQAQTSLVFGMILFSANRDTEALKYIEISLRKNSLLGNRRDNATALEYYFTYTYLDSIKSCLRSFMAKFTLLKESLHWGHCHHSSPFFEV